MTATGTPPLVNGVFDESVFDDPAFEPFRACSWPRPREDWERLARAERGLDAITLDVVEGGLESAIREAEAGVERTARSTMIREQHDYRASVNTVDCQSVTHVSFAATADPVRATYALDEMRPGDVFVYNDAYESHGTISQLPDVSVVVPVFASDRIVAFSQIFGHMTDVGGRVAGSLPLTSTSVFEEGIVIPPSRLYEGGKLNTELYRMILRNSRFPEDLRADLDAFVGAVHLIDRRVTELCDRLGGDVVECAMYRLIERCAATLRDHMLPLYPDGEFVGEDFADNDNITLDQPVRLQVTMRKDREKITLDWRGSSAQTAGPVNFVTDGRYLAKWLGSAFKAHDPGMVVNEGVTKVFRAHIPAGTVLSPRYPAAISNRMPTMLRCMSAYRVALVKALGGRTIADFNSAQLYGFFGVDDDGEDFLFREVFGAGSGARPWADGTDAVDMVPMSKSLQAEFVEQRYPVIVERLGLAADSAGFGQYRGGMGVLKELRVLVDGHIMSTAERTAFGPWGVNGGGAGAPGGYWINPGTADERHVQFRHEAIPVRAGDLVRIVTPGGGGWGDPLSREPDAVRLDVARRLVGRAVAERDYGVVLNDQSGSPIPYTVDLAATETLRAEFAATRAPLELIDRGTYAAEMKSSGRITYDDRV